MNSFLPEAIEYLRSFITEERWNRMQDVVARRTDYLSVVLEDIYQGHNASAVLRTCDCLGVHQIHFVENKNAVSVNEEISLGAEKWLYLQHWNSKNGGQEECLKHLKKNNFFVLATSPHKKEYIPENVPLQNPVAIVFGTEKDGLSDFWLRHADAFLHIPISGFTESYNISVSAAIILYTLVRRPDFAPHIGVPHQRKQQILFHWLMQSIRESEHLLNDFMKKKNIPQCALQNILAANSIK